MEDAMYVETPWFNVIMVVWNQAIEKSKLATQIAEENRHCLCEGCSFRLEHILAAQQEVKEWDV